jgi:hypothetical protein
MEELLPKEVCPCAKVAWQLNLLRPKIFKNACLNFTSNFVKVNREGETTFRKHRNSEERSKTKSGIFLRKSLGPSSKEEEVYLRF